jgi:LysE type translocator
MNYQLFSAFLLITFVLVIVPGPIVTLVIATGATRGIGAALMTAAGSTLGNAVLLACIALGLNWILKTSSEVFEIMHWVGAAYLVWLGIQSWLACRRQQRGHVAARTRIPLARLCGGDNQSKNHCFFHSVSAAICRSEFAGRISACGDVHHFGRDGRGHGCRLGDCRLCEPQTVPEAGAGTMARPPVRRGADWGRRVVVVGPTVGIAH